MALITNLFIVGTIIILGLVSQFIFKKTKIPDVLFLIAFGAALNYFGYTQGFNANSPEINFAIIFSLIYVVFYGALPIKLKALFSSMSYAFVSSLLNFISITAIIGLLTYLMGFTLVQALSIGALFCVLDGSIINGLLEIIKLSDKAEAQIQTESAIIDTLVIVGVLSIINFSQVGFNQVLQQLTSYIFLSFGIGLFLAVIWSFALKHIGNYSSAPVATMGLLVLIYAFAESVKANGVITVFSFSIVLGNVGEWSKLLYHTQKRKTSVLDVSTRSFFKDISFLIRTFLFVYLGILVNFAQMSYLLVGLGFFLIAYIVRSFIARIYVNKQLKKKDLYFLDAMCAKGLTPTVMLAVIQSSAIFANIVIGGIFSSVLITSILVFLIDHNEFTSISNIILKR